MKKPEQKNVEMNASEPASADPHPVSQEVKKAHTAPNNALSFEALQKIWPHVLDQMREDKKVSIQAMAKEARLESFSGNELTLAFLPEQTFLCERMGREDIKAYIAALIQQKTGRLLRLTLKVSAPSGTGAEGKSEKTEESLRRIVPEAILDITDES
jgi:DNA polymerase III subunit gamma/tau